MAQFLSNTVGDPVLVAAPPQPGILFAVSAVVADYLLALEPCNTVDFADNPEHTSS